MAERSLIKDSIVYAPPVLMEGGVAVGFTGIFFESPVVAAVGLGVASVGVVLGVAELSIAAIKKKLRKNSNVENN